MNDQPIEQGPSTRLEELMLDNALWGLDSEEATEFDRLAEDAGRTDSVLAERESFELAGAAAAIAFIPRAEEMPESVRELIENQAFTFLAGRSQASDSQAGGRGAALPSDGRALRPVADADRSAEVDNFDLRVDQDRGSWVPWITALASAAIILLAIEGFSSRTSAPTVVSAKVVYQELQNDPGSIRLDWEGDAGGEVLWNPNAQRGVMRFTGLRPNDSKVSQYQLWIFDDTRTHRHPVDGGVFDISESGEVLVTFDAKIPVRDAVAFVVTEEEPGGVVVSGRERIVRGVGISNIRDE